MDIKLLLFITVLFITGLQAQERKLSFNYDPAGNQVLKDMLCINCPEEVEEEEEEEVVVVEEEEEIPEQESEVIAEDDSEIEEEEEEEEEKTSKIIAYPNPVMDELHIDWIENPDKQPVAIELYSLDNKLQQSYKISFTRGVLRLPFHGYTPGVYFLVVTYNSGEQQSFNILKK